MIVSGLVLFLFGTAAVSAGPFIAPTPTEIIISRNKHSSDKIIEYVPHGSSGNSPFISNFLQKGTNVFFKPQFMLAAQQMPPQIQAMIAEIEKDDCKTSYPMGPVPVLPIVEEPLRIIEKDLDSPVINEVIEINPMPFAHPVELPKAPILIEEPCEAPILPTYIPRMEIAEPIVPVVVKVEEPRPHLVIPPAPVLPPFELPKLPVMVEEVPKIIEVEQTKEIVMPIIPPAPVLPPMELPKMPVLIEEPCAPVEVIHEVKPFILPEAPVLETFVPEPFVREVTIEEKPIVIPPAPVLPPYVPAVLPEVFVEKELSLPPVVPTVEIIEPTHPLVIPEAPVLPPYVPVEMPAPVTVEEIIKPAVIPPAPVLPPLEIPKISVLVDESNILPCPPGEEPAAPVLPPFIPEVFVPELSPVIVEERPVVIPEAPVLPAFTMPKFPIEVAVEEKFAPSLPTVEIIKESMIIPEAPILPPLAPLEIPVPMVVKEVRPPAPVLPSFELPKIPLVPCETSEVIEEFARQPTLLPGAPLLPPMTIPTPIIVEDLKPIVPPPAPVLPPFEFPKAPIVVDRTAGAVVAPCPPEDELIMPNPYSPYSLPVLPKMEMALKPRVATVPVPYAPLGYHF